MIKPNYALVEDGTKKILKEIDGDREFRSGVPPDLPRKAFSWLPIVYVDPPVDHDTEAKEGPNVVVTAKKVTKTWTVRPKNQDELDEMVAADGDMTLLVNTLVNAPVLNSTDFPADLISRVNARNRLNGEPEI